MQQVTQFLIDFENDFSQACNLISEATTATGELLSAVSDVAQLLEYDIKKIALPITKTLAEISPAVAVAAADQTCILRAVAIIFVVGKIIKTAKEVKEILQENSKDTARHQRYRESYARCSVAFNKLVVVIKKIFNGIYNYFSQAKDADVAQNPAVGAFDSPAYQQVVKTTLPQVEEDVRDFTKVPLLSKVVKTFSGVDDFQKLRTKLSGGFTQTYNLLEHAVLVLQSHSLSPQLGKMQQEIAEMRQEGSSSAVDFSGKLAQTIALSKKLTIFTNMALTNQTKSSKHTLHAVKKAVASVAGLFTKVQDFFSRGVSPKPPQIPLSTLARELEVVDVLTKKLALKNYHS